MQAPQKKESGGLLGRLFGHSEPKTSAPDAHSEGGTKSTLELGDIQGFILRGYRMPMVRHFLLGVGVPAAARRLLGRLVSGDESDTPQITPGKEGHVGSGGAPGNNPGEPPRRNPDYCFNVVITGPGLIFLEI